MNQIPTSADPSWNSAIVDLDGVKIRYLDNGGTGPALICLHGTSMTAHAWGHLGASLKDAYRVIAVDMRGHGASDRPNTTYTIAELAGDIARLAEKLNLKDITLIGSSVGNQVAVSFAAANPHRVAGLILSDPSFFVSDTEIVKYLRSHHTRRRNYPTRAEAEAFARALPQRAGLSDQMHRLAMEGDFRQEADGSWSWAYDLLAITKLFFNLSTDQAADIAAIEVPVLVLNADRSNVLSGNQAEQLTRAFPNARLEVVADSNHTIWGDQPVVLASKARAFLRDLHSA
ncbi:pimeloyl-ACP methyl ester carboxylesterase [Pseudaminobacter salicylatoxidans]|uniref:Pimeloyl-ACP methyl ester carboxylesterase n=1 Tax=Pseudaminobacter salicylatoxidans TaxID=93369 RepID=A0A316CA01_PSESE|nr:alpha/beta hydrolase [Pseudaminobacter salicylatoxidans]PWJ86591.1 pimeloyl-ACP methyl ester carboxylesterase [Pseudaminobacter salicylatoxidans]